MEILTLKINGVDLDLYPDEKVVQTFSLFNINDITARRSEYSNAFKVPKTTNNLQIIDYSHYVNNTTNFPFKKVKGEIYINGFLFKKCFVEIESIDNDITLRFYSGNIGFYELIKQKNLKDIDINNNPSLIIIWNLFNVLASRNATTGVFFPLVDYNGMADTGNTVDVRRLLPAYYKLSLIEAMCIDAGYTLVNELEGDALTAIETDIVPTASNKLENNADDIALNSYKGSMEDGTGDTDARVFGSYFTNFTQNFTQTLDVLPQFSKNLNFSTYVSGEQSRYFQPVNNLDYFQCNLSGVYSINYDLNARAIFYNSWDSTPVYSWNSRASYWLQVNGINVQEVGRMEVFTASGNAQTSLTLTDTLTGTLTQQLNQGDICRLVCKFTTVMHTGSFLVQSVNNTHRVEIFTDDASTFEFALDSGLAFGSQINPAQCLPNIKQNDFFKDTCIRYCILPYVDEDNKIVYLKEFKNVKDNISNAFNWSALVDETKDAKLTFKFGDYAQKNLYKHKEDKSVEPLPSGTDSLFFIQNENLPQEKIIYESCFAASITTTKLGTSEMIAIDLHDGTFFNNDVKPRCCYTRLINRTIDYTDGTTTTTVTTNIPHTWFISGDRSYNAGWENGLLTDYSSDIINILQSPKVLKIDIRLSLIDILNLNYFYPVYLEQYNSYFFLSQVGQFDYTSNDATEVELIKLI